MANYSQSMLQQLMTQQQAPQLSPVAAGVSSGIRRLGGLFGADTRTPQEKQAEALQEQVKSIDLSTPEGLMATARLYQGLGDMASASQFAQMAQQAKKEVRQQQITGLETAGEEATRRAEAAREKQQLREALNAARERDKPDEIRALTTGSISPSEYLKSLVEAKKGSEAKGYKVEKDVIIDGKEQSVVEFFDAQGNFLSSRTIGEVAGDGADAETPRGRNDWIAPEIKAYTKTQEDQRKAGAEAIKYNDLLNETIQIAGEKGQVGGILGTVRDFVIADVAGLGDAITIHRSRLNEVRMQNAIALLPRGPASDRDVKLALDASVDPKNLSPEDRVSYIRGMKKIADAEKEYMDGKLRWILQTGDALAFGYEQKVSLDGINRRVDAFRTDNATEVATLESNLQRAKTLLDAGEETKAKELVEYVKSLDTVGYLSLLEEQEAEQQRYDRFVEQNNIEFF